MNRIEWKRREGALRRLLRLLPDTNGSRNAHREAYRFGAMKHPNGLWYIYNLGSRNVIATVRLRTDLHRAVIRYRQASLYKNVLSSFKYGPHFTETLYSPSRNLRRHSRWARENMHRRVHTVWRRERAELRRQRTPRTEQPRDSRGRFMRADDAPWVVNPQEVFVDPSTYRHEYSTQNRNGTYLFDSVQYQTRLDARTGVQTVHATPQPTNRAVNREEFDAYREAMFPTSATSAEETMRALMEDTDV